MTGCSPLSMIILTTLKQFDPLCPPFFPRPTASRAPAPSFDIACWKLSSRKLPLKGKNNQSTNRLYCAGTLCNDDVRDCVWRDPGTRDGYLTKLKGQAREAQQWTHSSSWYFKVLHINHSHLQDWMIQAHVHILSRLVVMCSSWRLYPLMFEHRL